MRAIVALRMMAAALALMLEPFAPAPAFAAERSLTLDEAIALALRGNEGLVIERHSLAAARARVSAASGAYDPLLELNGGWARTREPLNSSFPGTTNPIAPEGRSTEAGVALSQLLPTGGAVSLRATGAREKSESNLALLSPAYRTRVGVELRQPLLRGLGSDAARRDVGVARSDRRGAIATLRRAVIETVAAVEQSYWALVAARLGVQVRGEAVRLAEEQMVETEARVGTGSSPRTELAQPRAELERRRGELLASREALARSENDLKLLILDGAGDAGWEDSLAPVETTAVDTVPADVPAALQHALARRPELEIAASVVERRRAESAFARSGVWPSLDAVVSYDRFGLAGSQNPSGAPGPIPAQLSGDLGDSFDTLKDGDYNAARVALVLGLPIRNRAARGSAAAARHVERQAETDLARVRKAIRAEVLDAAAALETADQRIDAARAGRQAAEIQLAAERDRFATGLTTNFLVLTRQNDLSRARLDEISALTDYRRARTEMGRASGSLIEGRGIAVTEATR
jgi:outer membrane protein TolC